MGVHQCRGITWKNIGLNLFIFLGTFFSCSSDVAFFPGALKSWLICKEVGGQFKRRGGICAVRSLVNAAGIWLQEGLVGTEVDKIKKKSQEEVPA